MWWSLEDPRCAHQGCASEPPTGSLPLQMPGSDHTPESGRGTVCFETSTGVLGRSPADHDLSLVTRLCQALCHALYGIPTQVARIRSGSLSSSPFCRTGSQGLANGGASTHPRAVFAWLPLREVDKGRPGWVRPGQPSSRDTTVSHRPEHSLRGQRLRGDSVHFPPASTGAAWETAQMNSTRGKVYIRLPTGSLLPPCRIRDPSFYRPADKR